MNTIPPYSSVAVANFFIEKGVQFNTPVSPMKLMKLVYLAHGWYLAYKDAPLIKDPIQAWKYGPVMPPLYQAVRQYGNQGITMLASEFVKVGAQSVLDTPVIPDTDTDTREFLTVIWNFYSKYSAIDLSTLTHLEGTPWNYVWNLAQSQGHNNVHIPDANIKMYYKSLMGNDSQAS